MGASRHWNNESSWTRGQELLTGRTTGGSCRTSAHQPIASWRSQRRVVPVRRRVATDTVDVGCQAESARERRWCYDGGGRPLRCEGLAGGAPQAWLSRELHGALVDTSV